MKVDLFMPLFIGDYLKDTLHLTTEQHGAYFLLLMAYWMRKGPLPDDDALLASIAKLPVDAWQGHKAILREFFQVADGKWHHKRVEAELQKAIALRKARSEAGKKGYLIRAQAKSKARASAEPPENRQFNPPARRENPSPPPAQVVIKVAPVPKSTAAGATTAATMVEPPSGFPATETEALAAAGVVGCPPEVATKAWNKALSRGGRDAKDIPIRNWRAHLAVEWSYEQSRVAERGRQTKPSEETRQAAESGPPPPGISPTVAALTASKEYERVCARLKQVSEGVARDANGTRFYTPKERDELAKLRKRRDELRQQLGIVI